MISDGELLLEAIVASPREDTPRLMYADWLIERGDDISVAHADLIKAQCKVSYWPKAGSPPHACPGCGYYPRDGLHHNSPECPEVIEMELLDALRPYLCPMCPVCDGTGRERVALNETIYNRPCSCCKGRCYIGQILRGFCTSIAIPHVQLLFEQHCDASRGYRKVWQPTPWAARMLSTCPAIQEIQCLRNPSGNGYSVWRENVPPPVWKRMLRGHLRIAGRDEVRYYEYPRASLEDISQAALAALRGMLS